MHENELVAGKSPRLRGGLPRAARLALDEAILRAAAAALRNAGVGRLRLTMPSGLTRSIGNGGAGKEASLKLRNYRAFWSALSRGSVGFAESYIDGDCASDDLNTLFGYFLANKAALAQAGRGLFRVRLPLRIQHLRNANTRRGSRRNIARHYDLGNAFYKHWLDSGMTYSSAIYTAETSDLEAAQREKNHRVLDALACEPGQSVLEIGCGWGGFLEAAAERGLKASGITISRQQFEFALARSEALLVRDKPSVAFLDYRDSAGQYDRIASIEMIEAVGEEHWPAYFGTISERLKPGGVAVVQAITIREDLFEPYRRKADFIQRYIFPGGMLPTVSAMEVQARQSGLSFEPLITFADSYARTLAEWRERFHAAWPQIAPLGFDERFRRTWDYYLAYCEAGFRLGSIDVGLYRFRKSLAGA